MARETAAENAAAEAPPLESGDHLTLEEFLRRYRAMPHVKKAELIDGVVFMPSPVSRRQHATPHGEALYWLCCYKALTPGVEASDNPTFLLGPKHAPQPDATLIVLPERGGQSGLVDDLATGAPELALEVSSSSASRDLHEKFELYCRAGVLEYLVWRTRDRAVDWFVLEHGAYLPKSPHEGILESRAFPGLRLDVDALLAGDLLRLRAAVEAGCATPEHAAFVAKLADAAKTAS